MGVVLVLELAAGIQSGMLGVVGCQEGRCICCQVLHLHEMIGLRHDRQSVRYCGRFLEIFNHITAAVGGSQIGTP